MAVTYPSKPYDIAYKPQSSIFAASCWDGYVFYLFRRSQTSHNDSYENRRMYIHQDNNRFALEVSDKPDVRPGTFLWGANSDNGALSDMLFVSSESERDKVCAHKAFDVQRQCLVYELDVNYSSESMALDPQGTKITL